MSKKKHKQDGQLLLEILIVTSIAAVIVALGANFIFISLRSNKAANERNVAVGMVVETMEAVRAASTEKWQNLFNLTHASNYYPTQASGKWVITTAGTENVVISGVTYTRSFQVRRVCRETAATRNITAITDTDGTATTCAESAQADVYDPNTEKVTAIVTWGLGESMSVSEYFAGRWRNKACNQTSWSVSGQGTATCGSGNYESQVNINTSNNELKLQ